MMRALLVLPLLVAGSRSASADQVIATDPVVPTPYVEPAPPPDPPPSESIVFLGGASQAWMTGDDGLDPIARGATLGFAFLQRDGEFPTGFEFDAVLLRGEDAAIYDLQSRVIGSPRLGRRMAVPFAALGLAYGVARLVTTEQKMTGAKATYGMSIGPTAMVGLHGFLNDSLYWRGGAGFLGTGIGAITAELSLGVVFGK
jgi:hypothetical protein